MTDYFAGGNTACGFYSLFGSVFGSVGKLYILKGSSGCGKSTLMKKLASHASAAGLAYERVFCSSDTCSLDGIIVPEKGFAVTDGTAPHLMDVKYPCVRESIINLGMFWDEEVLAGRECEIIALTDRKHECFDRAYRCLAASGRVRSVADSLILPFVRKSKLERLAEKLLIKNGMTQGVQRRVFSSAFTKNGRETLPTFENVQKLYRISSAHGFDRLLLATLASTVTEKGISSVLSLCPTDAGSFDALYLPESRTLFASEKAEPYFAAEAEKNVCGTRFFDGEGLKSVRVRARAAMKLSASLEEEASKYLEEASLIHSEIERIYIRGMDFRSLDAFTKSFVEKLFG